MIFVPVIMILAALYGRSQDKGRFPPFITPNTEYFVTRIGALPKIEPSSYRLEIKGLVQTPKKLTLEELYAMPMKELTLTVECIGNGAGGSLVSTAVWKGVLLHDILKSLGMSEAATGVRYEAADSYFASHTMAQVRDNGVIVALYMNGVPIPQLHGFPVRILNPGFYGVKQPAWITSIAVIDKPMKDYWEDSGWDCSPPIAVDSTFFFPKDPATVKRNEPLKLGGAAFGGTRVARVELTSDGGKTWKEASIVKKMDADNVWVFWEAELIFPAAGDYLVQARATDIRGRSQPKNDPDPANGTDEWPALTVKVKK
ncbi:MAG: molybdopterin-dependent oxidoreductase [Candidatus Aminicenantes bacterium]|nr:molybdopterin-dependent oxidoreductase [Candidatus Aminicenantes bacterium]